jgi:hypothetical protein
MRNIYCPGGKINFLFTTLIIAALHFLFSYFLFGFLFAMGESGEKGGFLISILAFLDKIIGFNPFQMALEFMDNMMPRLPIPNFVYFPTSFIINSLFWGLVITWLIITYTKFRKDARHREFRGHNT